MTPSSLRSEIKSLLDLLIRSEIAVAINPVIERKVHQALTRITWGSAQTTPGDLFRGNFASIDDYCDWLKAAAYSAILYDGSIVQMSYDFLRNQLAGHRLVYYPCPFDVDLDLLRSQPVLDVIDLYRGMDNSFVRLRSPLRYDYDPEAHADGHPAVHLTLLWEYCRWAVVAPLSPGHFIRFIFRHFYPHIWTAQRFIREWPQRQGDRTILPHEEGLLHVACSR